MEDDEEEEDEFNELEAAISQRISTKNSDLIDQDDSHHSYVVNLKDIVHPRPMTGIEQKNQIKVMRRAVNINISQEPKLASMQEANEYLVLNEAHEQPSTNIEMPMGPIFQQSEKPPLVPPKNNFLTVLTGGECNMNVLGRRSIVVGQG